MSKSSKLPQIQDKNQNFQLLQNKWSSILNPLIANPLSSALILDNVQLVTGFNIVPHKLGRVPQGWFITDIDAAVGVFRAKPFNPDTISLTTNGACTISLAIY